MVDSANYRDHEREIAPARSSKALVLSPLGATEKGCTLFVGTAGNLCVDLVNDPVGTKTIYKGVVGDFSKRVGKVYGATDGTTAADIVMEW